MVSNKLLGLPPVLLCRTHTSIVSCHIHLIQTRSQIWYVKAIMRMKFLKFFILVLIGLGFFLHKYIGSRTSKQVAYKKICYFLVLEYIHT
jgi:hypothetical protein